MMNDTLEYPYKPNPKTMILAILFFGGCAAVGVVASATNHAGLIIDGLITLSVRGATIFWACMAGASMLFVLGGVWGLVQGRTNPGVVRLGRTEISAPRARRARQPTVVRLSDVQGIAVHSIQGQLILNIRHPDGTLRIMGSMLPSADAFEDLCRALRARLDALPSASAQPAGRA